MAYDTTIHILETSPKGVYHFLEPHPPKPAPSTKLKYGYRWSPSAYKALQSFGQIVQHGATHKIINPAACNLQELMVILSGI